MCQTSSRISSRPSPRRSGPRPASPCCSSADRNTATVRLASGLALDCGRTLTPLVIAYEQYGRMNADRSNVILACHALSGGAQAAGRDERDGRIGWWDAMIGDGRAFDTSRYCVLCANVPGSCYGTTGPASIDPATGRPFGPDFPAVTIRDMVRAQAALLDVLGVRRLAAVAGGSMGGMQALAWPVLYPDRVERVVAIAATDRHSPRQIALNEVARRAVTSDPDWAGGRYYPGPGPRRGLAVARMLGHVTYLSDAGMQQKFGRRTRGESPHADLGPEFEVEHYLAHQGRRFVERFDANSLLYLTKALDRFDLSEGWPTLDRALEASAASFLFMAFSSDWLYPPEELERVAEAAAHRAGRAVTYRCLESDRGHDAFLLEHERQGALVREFLDDGAAAESG